jgi:hypothetical protein
MLLTSFSITWSLRACCCRKAVLAATVATSTALYSSISARSWEVVTGGSGKSSRASSSPCTIRRASAAIFASLFGKLAHGKPPFIVRRLHHAVI